MRLIDAYSAKEAIEYTLVGDSASMAQRVIDSQPTVDAVPVVCCRECKKHSEANGKHYCKFWRMYCPDDSEFFCKAGERKEGAE